MKLTMAQRSGDEESPEEGRPLLGDRSKSYGLLAKRGVADQLGLRYRPDIDGLRAVAVLAVVLFHANSAWLPGGFAGVDIFFVISGYVVTSSLLAREDGSKAELMLGFFLRRAKRLLPALACVCLTSGLALSWVAPSYTESMVPKFMKVAISGVLGNANNWLLGQELEGWTLQGVDEYNPFLHLWSLGIEEQFYLIFPMLLIIGLYGISSLWSTESRATPSSASMLCLLAVLMVVSGLMSWQLELRGLKAEAAYLLPCRFWELAAGAALVLCSSQLALALGENRSAVFLLQVMAFAFIATAFTLAPSGSWEIGSHMPFEVLAVVGTLCYITAGLAVREEGQSVCVAGLNSALSYSFPVYLGRLSYSIYLWHVPILAMLAWISPTGKHSVACLAGASLLILILSSATMHLVEEPMRRLRGWSNSKTAFVLLGMSVGAALWLAALMWAREADSQAWLIRCSTPLAILVFAAAAEKSELQPGQKFRSVALLAMFVVVAQEMMLYKSASVAVQQPFVQLAQAAFNQTPATGCSCKTVNANVKTKPPGAQPDNGQALPDCFPEHPVNQATFMEPQSNIQTCIMPEGFGGEPIANKLKCLAPDGIVGTKTKNAIYLIGDSHSAMLRTGVGSATNMPVFSASWWGSYHTGQVAHIEDALNMVIQPNDIIFYAMRWDARGVEMFNADVEVILRVIKARTPPAHLVIVEDNPVMKSAPATCYMSAARGQFPTQCSRTITDVSVHAPEYKEAIERHRAAHPGYVYYFETQALLCDTQTQTCDYNVPGSWAPAYRDNNHISEDGSRYLSPFICSALLDYKLHTGGLH